MRRSPDDGRAAVHAAVSTRLALMSDRRIGEAVAAAAPLGSGMGGRAAGASLVLFLEHVPHTLGAWLAERREAAARGGEAPPFARIDEALARGAEFMSAQGFVHFDAHFRTS
ncbi:hypothetical protein ACFWNC_17450 [Streptomyces sp. NPDC058369]|uniref:hypothetical protein n=1 Tax=Streptomyces sp. NPDC058369 TaxID=3346462 RepID=UPI00365F1DD2